MRNTQKTISLNNFDFNGFTEAILEFLGGQISEEIHPSWAIVTVDEPRGTSEYGPEEGRSNFLDELQSGQRLFFPFSSSNVGEPVPCADGESRQVVYDEEDETKNDFIMGDVDCVGFLFKLEDNKLCISLAIHAGGSCPGAGPAVKIEKDCGVFTAGMNSFIDKFVIE